MCYSSNLVEIPRSSSYSSLVSHLALSVPTLGLLVIFRTSALSLIRPNMLDLLSSFCSCYKVILTLNSSIVSFLSRLISRSLKSSYFLILVLTFQSLGWTLYSTGKSSKSIYLSPSLVTVYTTDSLISLIVLIYVSKSWFYRILNPKLASFLSFTPALVYLGLLSVLILF